eukprot:CAMPEP_0196792590 /NCGR_PEP_ID=MMETSP1104-20130614/31691_1 /TAXON_ID=33652 /ORGANISM="Cafeteria sp., Strain Caron Lab Isolate" /LENGTH=109 /DNA_ID=CAMNT_0042162957 /DNA_START=153 /DNA_END=480 /DNA_ORIENTATION=+
MTAKEQFFPGLPVAKCPWGNPRPDLRGQSWWELANGTSAMHTIACPSIDGGDCGMQHLHMLRPSNDGASLMASEACNENPVPSNARKRRSSATAVNSPPTTARTWSLSP